MKLIILGKTKDDKGSQLEQLTSKILASQGYTNIVNNVQVSGASELDVTAQKKDIVGISEITTPVICECKAHEKPITMTDWLKFVGKLYIARITEPRTIGLMLALSGANGSVVGSYQTDFQHDSGVQLIANDDIILLLSKIYELPDATSLKAQLSSLPIPVIVETSLVYYNSVIWWLIGCEDGRFILCHSDSRPATFEEVKDIIPMLPSATIYQEDSFVDIWNSLERKAQALQIGKLIVSELLDRETIGITEAKQLFNGVDDKLFDSAVENCEFISIDELKSTISICDFTKVSKISFYRYLLESECPVKVFASSFYRDNINEQLLEQIWTIQGGFKLPDEQIANCIQILRLSPSAMIYALQPDRTLFGAPKVINDEGMSNMYYNHFMGNLLAAFINDFKSGALSALYVDSYHIQKVIIATSASIINVNSDSMKIGVEENFMLNKISDSNQVAMVVTKKGI